MNPPSLYAFEISLHRRGDAAPGAKTYVDAGTAWPLLAVRQEDLAIPLAIGFDEALARLARLERMYAEPDGSFVWTSSRAGLAWQVDGNLFDKDGRVLLVDMKGTCPPEEFDRLLRCFGWPAETVMMQVVRPAVFLEETVFRRHALARGAAESGETGPV
jgi:hypothetical protein